MVKKAVGWVQGSGLKNGMDNATCVGFMSRSGTDAEDGHSE